MSDILDLINKDQADIAEQKQTIGAYQNGLDNELNEDSPGWTDYTLDGVLSAALEGPALAIDEFDRFAQKHLITTGYLQIQNEKGEFDLDIITPSEVKEGDYKMLEQRRFPQIYKPETEVGEVTATVGQFVTGFIGPNKFLKGKGLGGTLGKSTLRGMAAGAVADFTVFNPHEGNLSNVLEEFNSPILNNTVTQYLSIDEDDGDLEARMKLMLEGVVLGGVGSMVAYPLFVGIRAIKKSRQAKKATVEEKERIIKEEGGDIISDVIRGTRSRKTRRKMAEINRDINPDIAENIKITKETKHGELETLFEQLFNTASFSTKGALRSIDDVIQLFTKEELGFMKDGVLTDKAAKGLAQALGENPESVIKGMSKTTDEAMTMPIKVLAAKAILQRLGLQIERLSVIHNNKFNKQGIRSGDEFEQSAKNINKTAMIIRQVSMHLKLQIKSAAQTTQKGNVQMAAGDSKIIDIDKLEKNLDLLDGDSSALAKAIAESKDINTVLEQVHKGKALRAFQSLYINSLLSSHWTQTVNLLSNAYQAIGQPAARIVGGVVTKNAEARRHGFAQFAGMYHNASGMWEAIWRSLRYGDPVLDTKIQTQDYLENGATKAAPISGDALDLTGTPATVADWFGHLTQLPSRALVTGDEFFKQLNYRGAVYAQAMDLVLKRNIDPKSKQGKKLFKEILDNAFDANGRANVSTGAGKFKSLYKDALYTARENTFQLELKGNDVKFAHRLPLIGSQFNPKGKSWGETVETVVNTYPGLRFIIPFIRTPTNLWRQAVEYTPGLGMYTNRMQKLYYSGPQGRADVIGRQLIGSGMVFTGWMNTQSKVEVPQPDGKVIELPKMTGRGPSDYRTRKLWKSFGWQEYSFLVKGKKKVNKGTEEKPKWVEVDAYYYKQYNRMDPRFFHWGIIADLSEAQNYHPNADLFDMFGNLLVSVMKNVGDKSYTKGVGDVIKLFEDPDESKVSKFFGKQVSNFAPYNTFRKNFDLEAKDFRSFSDRMLDALYMGDKLEPQRDIFGKPITRAGTTVYTNDNAISSLIQGPFLIGRKSELHADWWKVQIMALTVDGNLNLTPPKQFIKGKQIDLAEFKNDKGQTALDFWREKMGTIKISGRTLEEAIKRKVESRTFEKAKTGDENFEGKKEFMIEQIYNRYKEKAFNLTKKSYPDLKDAIREVDRNRRSNRRSGVDQETITGAPGSTTERLIMY